MSRKGLSRAFFTRVLAQAKTHLSDEHFTVDGTLIEAWTSQKSFQEPARSSDLQSRITPDGCGCRSRRLASRAPRDSDRSGTHVARRIASLRQLSFINEHCASCGLWNWHAILAHSFQVKFHRLADVGFSFFCHISIGDAARQLRHPCPVVARPFSMITGLFHQHPFESAYASAASASATLENVTSTSLTPVTVNIVFNRSLTLTSPYLRLFLPHETCTPNKLPQGSRIKIRNFSQIYNQHRRFRITGLILEIEEVANLKRPLHFQYGYVRP